MASAPETAPSPEPSTPPAPPANVDISPPPIDSSNSSPPADSSPLSPPPTESPPPPSSPPLVENSDVPSSIPPPPSSPPLRTPQSPPPTPSTSSSSSSSSSPPPPSSSSSTHSPPPSPSTVTKNPPSAPSSSETNSTSALKGLANVPPSRASSLSKDDSKTSSSNGQSDSNLPLVIGVSLGVGIFMALMVVALILCTRNRKKKKPFYYDHGALGTEGGFYPAGSHRQNIGKIPPPPGAPNGAWTHSQTPPSAMMYNGEMSSGGFSSSHGPSVLPPPSPILAIGFNKSTFTYEELAAATNGFSQANLLGQGGFGYVFKGILPNGKEVAVKQLKADSGQGEKEFHAEVEIISRVHHRHLVSLVGYCITGQHRLLVYEFIPNKTLEYHLYGKGLPTMDWPTRLKVAMGSAKGLAYLHEDCHPRIIHRDIKAANILIDYKFEAMVADFGLAKLSEDTNTHVSTRIMGTFGYLAPEYASSGKLTEKSDVFSFGVMLLELITGRRPIDHAHLEEDSLVDWARPLLMQALSDENFEGIVDPRLENNYNTVEMARMIACAAASIRHSARRRPKMSQVVRALEGDVSLDDLNEGVKPGQSVFFSSSGSDADYASYNTRMKQFRRAAMGTDDYSNGYSGVTSEYGLNPSVSSSSGEISTAGSTRGHTRN